MAKKKGRLEFLEMKKNGEKVTWVTAYDFPTAMFAEAAGLDMILVGDSLGMVVLGYPGTIPVTMEDCISHCKAVRRGAPNTFVVGDMPFGTYNVNCDQAITTANRIMQEGGSDCVKLEGGANMADRIAAIVKAGIPVMAHIGLTPQSISALGGFKVQGKDRTIADKLVEDAVAVTEAGAFAICLECMPSVVAKKITETVRIPCAGIGAGPYCDAQELNLYDMTGLFGDFKPKFVKHYAKLRQPMVDALNRFYDETCAGTFPTPEFSYNASVEGY